jgi:hypothetical protein
MPTDLRASATSSTSLITEPWAGSTQIMRVIGGLAALKRRSASECKAATTTLMSASSKPNSVRLSMRENRVQKGNVAAFGPIPPRAGPTGCAAPSASARTFLPSAC